MIYGIWRAIDGTNDYNADIKCAIDSTNDYNTSNSAIDDTNDEYTSSYAIAGANDEYTSSCATDGAIIASINSINSSTHAGVYRFNVSKLPLEAQAVQT